jgi:DNA-binding IclR family transcriptional regulator
MAPVMTNDDRRGERLRVWIACLARLEADWCSVYDLALAGGVHVRTVWRVLAVLRAAGAVRHRRQGSGLSRYRLRADWLRRCATHLRSEPPARRT